MTTEEIDQITQKLSGTSGIYDSGICEEHGISNEELEELMVDAGYERCSECEWWCETSELVDDESEPCPCDSCRPKPID